MNHNSVALIVTAWDDIITSFTCMLFCGTKHGMGGFWERGGLIKILTTVGGMPPPVTARGLGER